MDILIYGAGYNGKIVLELLQKDYKDSCNMTGFIDKYKNGEYCGYPVYRIEEAENFRGRIILALSDFEAAKDVCGFLKDRGHKDIFWFSYKREIPYPDNFFVEQCNDCKAWKGGGGGILLQAEMHVMDSCNLNCRGCTHYAPIFPNDLPDLNSRLLDVRALSGKLSHIVRFFILGGEPFLNPEINSYICGIRAILPDTQLFIVTNGLLIEHLSKETLECIKNHDVWIHISEYEPTRSRMHNIREILNTYHIYYEVRKAIGKRKFNLPLSLSESSKYPRKCISDGCVTIWNGKIARCPSVMYISHFNEYFHTNLPEEGIMELEHCAAGEKLLHVLQEEIPLCRHCVWNEMEWSVCGRNAKLEDFAVAD